MTWRRRTMWIESKDGVQQTHNKQNLYRRAHSSPPLRGKKKESEESESEKKRWTTYPPTHPPTHPSTE